MKKMMIAIIAAALLCSCADTETNQAIKTRDLPANYGAVALAAVKSSLKDPDSVRTLQLSPDPINTRGGNTSVMVYVNAKNSFGGYTGVEPVLVLFKNGQVIDIVQ